MGRGWRGVGHYGLFKTAIYVAWVLWATVTLRKPRLRGKVLGALAQFFKILGIKRIPVTVNDVRLYIDPRNGWSIREYALRPNYDHREIFAVKKAIPGNYTFVDVGANFGAWSFALASHFSRVVSVEPDTRCYECCRHTSNRSRLSNVDQVNVALSDRDGDGSLYASAGHIGDSRIDDPGDEGRLIGTPVKLMSFDSLVDQYDIDSERLFIKIDAQGAEPKIFRGMERSLRAAKDMILFAELQAPILADVGSSVEECFSLLNGLGFVPVDLFNGLAAIGWDNVSQAQATSRDYCFRFSGGNSKHEN